MPLNFRSAFYLTAGNSTATMRQTGARALWPSGREHSPHSVCWRAPVVICPVPTALKDRCHHSKWHRVLQSQNQLQTFFLRKQRAHLAGLAGHCTHRVLAAGIPLSLAPTGPAQFNTRDRAVSAFKNWQLWAQAEETERTFFLEREQVVLERASSESRSCPFTCPVHLLVSREKALVSISPSDTDIPRKAGESRIYSGITCVLPLTKQVSHPLEVTNQSTFLSEKSL